MIHSLSVPGLRINLAILEGNDPWEQMVCYKSMAEICGVYMAHAPFIAAEMLLLYILNYLQQQTMDRKDDISKQLRH